MKASSSSKLAGSGHEISGSKQYQTGTGFNSSQNKKQQNGTTNSTTVTQPINQKNSPPPQQQIISSNPRDKSNNLMFFHPSPQVVDGDEQRERGDSIEKKNNNIVVQHQIIELVKQNSNNNLSLEQSTGEIIQQHYQRRNKQSIMHSDDRSADDQQFSNRQKPFNAQNSGIQSASAQSFRRKKAHSNSQRGSTMKKKEHCRGKSSQSASQSSEQQKMRLNTVGMSSHGQQAIASNGKTTDRETLDSQGRNKILTKRSQKVIKVKWMGSNEDDQSQRLRTNQHLFTSKETRPVVRQGQQFTQVNLKIKQTSKHQKTKAQSGSYPQQQLSITNSSQKQPHANINNRPNIFAKRPQSSASKESRPQNHLNVQTLRQKVLQHEMLGGVQQRQVNEVQHPENQVESVAANLYAENFTTAKDSIPGNSQEMAVWSPSSAVTEIQKRAVTQGALEHEEMHHSPQHYSRRTTKTPLQDFRSQQQSSQSIYADAEEQKRSSRIIQMDRDQFPMMPLLPPASAEMGSDRANQTNEPGRAMPTISQDQRRLKLETKLQKLRNKKPMGESDVAAAVGSEIVTQEQEGSLAVENNGEETKQHYLINQFILQTAQLQTENQKLRQELKEQGEKSDNKRASATPPRIDPSDYQNFAQSMVKTKEREVKNEVGSNHQYSCSNDPHNQLKQIAIAEMQYDSFIEDERCSPREMSISQQNVSSQANFTAVQISKDSKQKRMGNDRSHSPLVFNELARKDFEILIGSKQRRELVKSNQKVRKNQLSKTDTFAHNPRKVHARNHSQLLSAQFSKKDMDIGPLRQAEADLNNDKFNVDGNDVGNITSSDEELNDRVRPQAIGGSRQENQRQSTTSNLDNKYEDTSIGECEVDEDTGRGQHLQQQISKNTIGERSITKKSTLVNFKLLQQDRDFLFLDNTSNEEGSGLINHQFSNTGFQHQIQSTNKDRNRFERTPQARNVGSSVFFSKLTPNGKFQDRSKNTSQYHHYKRNSTSINSVMFQQQHRQQQFQGADEEQKINPFLGINGYIAVSDQNSDAPSDEYNQTISTNNNKNNKNDDRQLKQSTSVGSQLIPATMAKRKKQTSGHRGNFSPSDDHQQPRSQKQLPQLISRNPEACPDDPSHLLSSISINNNLAENGTKTQNDKKQQIKMFTANSRTDHFSESKIVFRLSLPENINNIEEMNVGGDGFATFEKAENILSSDRMALNQRDPHLTEIMLKTSEESILKPILAKVSHQSNTDNKDIRKMSQTMQKDSNRGGKHYQETQQYRSIMSPIQNMQRSITFRDQLDITGLKGPQPMDSFSELRLQQQRSSFNNPQPWAIQQPTVTPATPGGGIDVLSNGYMMSSIGQVGEVPPAISMYAMREFMNEPGASKQITADTSKRFQKKMQQQRRIRSSQRTDNKETSFVQEDEEDLDQQSDSATRKTNQNTGQKHARKRQKSLETTMAHFQQDKSVSDNNSTNNGQQHQQPKEFKIITNEATGEVKLKILRKDAMYVPREVLQDASIFSQVTVLDISNCRIVELEGRIFMQLQNLSKLYAARNQIKYLSGRISECTQLTHINLDCNQLEMIPSEIGLLKNSLIVLKLAQNKLKQLTLSTRELEKLEILNISDNCLNELPDGMDDLINLRELHLSGNALVQFNVLIGHMPKLSKISLDWFSFLVPNLQSTVPRTSQFNIDQALQEHLIRSQKQQSSQFKMSPPPPPHQATNQNLFSPLRQQKCDESHANYLQRSDSNLQLKPATGNRQSVPQQTSTQTMEEFVMLDTVQIPQDTHDEDVDGENMLSIASERNNQKSYTMMGNPALGNAKAKVQAQFMHQSANGGPDDIFRELAIIVEEVCGRSPSIRNNHDNFIRRQPGKGLDFYTFAEHFTRLFMGGQIHNKDWISQQDVKGRTMLHYAAQKGDINVIQALIEKGADKTKLDQYQFNPYGLALREEHFTAAMYLLRTPSFAYFDVYSGAGTFGSLIHLAVTKLQVDQVRVILEHDVSPNVTDQISGDSLLHVLMNLYHKQSESGMDILKCLSDFGVDYNIRNRENWTPFHVAVKRGSHSAIKAMLEVAGNKSQKSWLAAKTQSPAYVDIDATGGPRDVTALHLATENNYYDIVDLLFRYKADIFLHDEKGDTAFTGVTNNLLMIKLLKKEQKSYFNESFKRRLQAKEMHITNDIYVKQALKDREHPDPILAQYMNGKYHSLKETLKCVQSQLELPMVTHKRAFFRQQSLIQDTNNDFTGDREGEVLIDTIDEVTPAIRISNSIITKVDDQGANATSECLTICSDEIDENKEQSVGRNVSLRSLSPTPGSLSRLRNARNSAFAPQNNTNNQLMYQSYYNKTKAAAPRNAKKIQIQAYQQQQTVSQQQPSNYTSYTVPTQSSLTMASNNIGSWSSLRMAQNIPQNKQSVVLNNMAVMNKPQAESPRFQQQSSSPPVFSYAAKSSKNTKRQSLSMLGEKKATGGAARQTKIDGTRNTIPTKVALKPKVLPLSDRTMEQASHRSIVGEKDANTETQEKLITMRSIQNVQGGIDFEEANSPNQMVDENGTNTDVEVEDFDMDRISDTLEPRDSLERNIREVQNARQSEITFRLKVDHQNHYSVINSENLDQKQQQHSQVVTNKNANHLTEQRHSTKMIDDQRDRRHDNNDYQEVTNALQGLRPEPKRQASVKATGSRRLIPNDIYGTGEEAIPLTVNASKNLFGDEIYRKTMARTANVETEEYIKTSQYIQNYQHMGTSSNSSSQQQHKQHSQKQQMMSYNQHQSQNVIGESLQQRSSAFAIKQKSTAYQPNTLLGGLSKVRESNLIKKENRLRDQKNVAILNQSMNHRSHRPKLTEEKKGAQLPLLQNKQTLLIAPHNILYNNQEPTDQINNATNSAAHQLSQKSLKIVTINRGGTPAAMQNFLSPTAADDDDAPYKGIAMPEHQHIYKMTKVISESGKQYSSQGSVGGRRVSSLNSRTSIGGTEQRKKIGLEQLLMRKSVDPAGNSQKLISTRKIMATAESQPGARMQTFSSAISSILKDQRPSLQYSQHHKAEQPQSTHSFQSNRSQSQQHNNKPKASQNSHPLSKEQQQKQQQKQLREDGYIQNIIGKTALPQQTQILHFKNPQFQEQFDTTQLQVPQKPRLQGKKLMINEDGPRPFFYKYLPNHPVQSSQIGPQPISQQMQQQQQAQTTDVQSNSYSNKQKMGSQKYYGPKKNSSAIKVLSSRQLQPPESAQTSDRKTNNNNSPATKMFFN